MPEFLSSKVVVTEAVPRTRPTGTGATAVTGFLGTSEKGPVNVQTLCTSLDEFRDVFGGHQVGCSLPATVESFFANGGTLARVARIAHYANVADPGTLQAKASFCSIFSAGTEIARVHARTPGHHGDALQVELTAIADRLRLEVLSQGKRLEEWRDLSCVAESPRFYASQVSAQSRFVDIELVSGREHTAPETQTAMLAGGEDAIDQMEASDYTGDVRSQTGMHAFDTSLDISVLAVPDAPPEVQRAAVAYCSKQRRGLVLPLFDLPAGLGAIDAAAYMEREKLQQRSEHGAMYWPRILIENSAPQVCAGKHVAISPVGAAAGVLARLATARPGGVYGIPAGIEAAWLEGVVGLDSPDSLDEAKRDIVYPARINPLTSGPGLPFYIDGAQTLKGDGNCPWISHRRGMSHIERGLERMLQYVRHKALTSGLEAQVYRDTKTYLTQEMEAGAFASLKTQEAFSLAVERETGKRRLRVSVGLAFAEPAEFVWLNMSVVLAGGRD